MKFLMHEDIPRWYHIFWNNDICGLCIRVHRFFFAHCEHKNFEPYFKGIDKAVHYRPLFDSYEPMIGQTRFGINDSIVLIKEDAEWMTYRIKLPCILQTGNLACEKCDGTGRRYPEEPQCEEVCWQCDGTKTQRSHDYDEVQKTCFSLAIFLNALQFPIERDDIFTLEKQLFTLTSCCIQKAHGHSVGGYASPEFVRFWETLSNSSEHHVELPTVKDVMKKVHETLFGELKSYYRHGFDCWTRGGQIILRCPGDACEIHTDADRRIGNGHGEEITCHNLDSGVQQLTLLSGMAELSSLYDRMNLVAPKSQ